MVLLAIVVGSTAGAFAQKKSVRSDWQRFLSTHVSKEGKCDLKVEVIDENLDKIFTERINQKKFF